MDDGYLVRVRHGVYATASAVANVDGDPRRMHCLQALATIRAVGCNAVTSHHSAAVIHHLKMLTDAPVDLVTLTRPDGKRHGWRNVILHTARLPARHVTTRAGVPVTTVARTVIDLARTGSFMEGVTVADSALHQRLASKAQLREVLTDCVRWPGAERAGKVVDFSDGRAESVLESCARVLFAGHGLEPPDLQVNIRDGHDLFIGRVDFYWPRHRTIAEADGLSKLAKPAVIHAQFRRDRLLHRAGYKVVHFTWREIFNETASIISIIHHNFTEPPPPAT